jgi:hypothetical protein
MFKNKSLHLKKKDIPSNKSTLKECTTFKQNEDARYSKIIKQVQNMNSVVIRDISISGEAINGVFSIVSEVTFLRLCMENDVYHPHIYRWSVGVSSGSIALVIILNARYLYECHSKEIALEYLKAVEQFLNFNNLRALFYNLGEDKTLGDFAPDLLFKNIFLNGSLCSREALIQLAQGTHKKLKFDNKQNYFLQQEYYDWLDVGSNLDNLFIVCYAQSKTRMVVYTGDDKRFENPSIYIRYENLSSKNLIHAVLCSSSIALLYPQEEINTTEGIAIDGASVELTQALHTQILINVSFNLPDNLLFTPILLFFKITPKTNNNFLISVNKINIQERYEDLLEFRNFSNPLVNAISSRLSLNARAQYNAEVSVPFTALYATQPYIEEFSINDFNKNFLQTLQEKKNTIQKNVSLLRNSFRKYSYIPTIPITEEQFNSETDVFGLQKQFSTYGNYLNVYNRYKEISSNIITSSYLYGYSVGSNILLLNEKYQEQLDKNGKKIVLTLNICYTDVFVRNSFQSSENISLNLLLNRDTKLVDALTGMGFFSGCSMFDLYIKQSLYTVNKNKVTSSSLRLFANDIEPVVSNSTLTFLGPKYVNLNNPF